jgi:acyl-CoA reductase-like NAD-dependent aldehyde dehydrogenase
METITGRDTLRKITTHYIDGAFVESRGREVMDVIKPTNGQVIARVTLGEISCASSRGSSKARQSVHNPSVEAAAFLLPGDAPKPCV